MARFNIPEDLKSSVPITDLRMTHGLSEISVIGARLPNVSGFMADYYRALRDCHIPYHLLFCGSIRVCILVSNGTASKALSDLHHAFIENLGARPITYDKDSAA